MDIKPEEFRSLGTELIDHIAKFLGNLRSMPIVPDESPVDARTALATVSFPEQGMPADQVLREACNFVFDHSTLIPHPRFFSTWLIQKNKPS